MFKILTLTTAITLTLAGGAMAANNSKSEGLVNVSLGDVVISQLVNDLNVDVSQIPVTLQVPVGIAANICNIDANVLASDKSGPSGAACEATNTSQAFTNLVQKNLVAQQ
ncbi:MAG: hypothetical protein JWR75_1535 [Devosia sp.]|nr:hypothetical protein [Devosia sp.]